MTHTVATPKRSVQDALYTLAIEKAVPDAAVLDEVIRAYPEFAEELTDFAIDIAIDHFRNRNQEDDVSAEPMELGVVSPAVSRAMSRFQNRLHAVQTVSGSEQRDQNPTASRFNERVENPFTRLNRDEFRDLALRLGANSVFVAKLRDRQIQASSIPARFHQRLADEMQIPLDSVIAHLGAPLAAPQGQFFKAEGKPHNFTQQTFTDAVRGSGLSQSQQDALLGL